MEIDGKRFLKKLKKKLDREAKIRYGSWELRTAFVQGVTFTLKELDKELKK